MGPSIARTRRLMQGAFNHESLQSYQVMLGAVDRTLATWPLLAAGAAS